MLPLGQGFQANLATFRLCAQAKIPQREELLPTYIRFTVNERIGLKSIVEIRAACRSLDSNRL
jgi:hypothetical protein